MKNVDVLELEKTANVFNEFETSQDNVYNIVYNYLHVHEATEKTTYEIFERIRKLLATSFTMKVRFTKLAAELVD